MTDAANSLEGKAKQFVERIERELEELESLKGTYMNAAKQHRAKLKDIYAEAKDAGIPVRSIKGVIKLRDLERKIDKLETGLNDEESVIYERIVETLGPLGVAAAKRAGFGQGPAPTQAEKAAAAEKERQEKEERLARLGRGKNGKSNAVDSLADNPLPAA